jgi:hypothetical protein
VIHRADTQQDKFSFVRCKETHPKRHEDVALQADKEASGCCLLFVHRPNPERDAQGKFHRIHSLNLRLSSATRATSGET